MSRIGNRQRAAIEISNEEQLIPVIRASLAKNLADQGFRISEIARALKVTQPAVTQYLEGKRGTRRGDIPSINTLVDPLAERVAKKIRPDFRSKRPSCSKPQGKSLL